MFGFWIVTLLMLVKLNPFPAVPIHDVEVGGERILLCGTRQRIRHALGW